MIMKTIRNYEVSLWTLQDEFITVLKWSDVEPTELITDPSSIYLQSLRPQGTIQDPEMEIADDGTQNFKFSIPMYLYKNGKFIENPIWYNTRNGNLMVNLRKIKVNFNKLADRQPIFEFLITKITEEHEQDHLFCRVECEGLAFHELGKTGYTYALSQADAELDYKLWQQAGAIESMKPIFNVQYWCEKIGLVPYPAEEVDVDPRIWYYKIEMNWDSFQDIIQRYKYTVYEEAYVTAWEYDAAVNELVPKSVDDAREKERMIEISESNIYNITQTIAEQFGIYCKYEYEHDSNQHITARKVVFFNNFLHDEHTFSLTYPYSSTKITREMDSTDTITKMYVKSVEDNSTLLGEASIRYCDANQMQEDYIFNFDYLKETNSITDEQYEAVTQYEKDIHNYNAALIPLQNKISVYENQQTDLEAKIAIYKNSIAQTEEAINNNEDLAYALITANNSGGASTYIDSYNNTNPQTGIIIQDDSGYYINLNTAKKGIHPNSMHIYRERSSTGVKTDTEITGFSFEFDENNNPIRIRGIAPLNNSSMVYMTYTFEPRLYYEQINQSLRNKAAVDKRYLREAEAELEQLIKDPVDINEEKGLLIQARIDRDQIIANKKIAIDEFNFMMGPALREGNWTPEKYQDYGEHYEHKAIFHDAYLTDFTVLDTGTGFTVGWDSKLFDEEQDIYYELGIEQTPTYYPCINLSTIPSDHYFWSHLDEYSFIFNNNFYDPNADLNNIKNIRSFKIGSEAILGFVTSKDAAITGDVRQVYPVLILLGAKSMTTSAQSYEHESLQNGGMVGFMLDPAKGHPRLSIINSEIEGGAVVTTVEDHADICITLDNSNFKFNNSYDISNYMAVYPRIKFSSLKLKYQENSFFIHYNNNLLENYKDYYIRNRNIDGGTYAPEFYITIKPQSFLTYRDATNEVYVGYTLSNAGTAIYLDAIEIMKENAYPKVSYTIDPSILDRNIISTLYERLNWLVMINDAQLKLVNTFGYISKITLNLDFPDKDQIEVKNYKSKFEDLFSTIVASSEAMKKNEGALSALSAGIYNVSSTGMQQLLNTNKQVMDNYLDDYFTHSDAVDDYLSDIFTDVGSIIGDSASLLNQTQSVHAENQKILSNFAIQVTEHLTPQIFRSVERPLDFKSGDIWIRLNEEDHSVIGRYLATANSSDAHDGYGWVKTYGGSLSEISGPGLDIDAAAGTIDILAPNNITLASNNVNIVGNNEVNIGGVKINLGALSNNSNAYSEINLVASAYNEDFTQNIGVSKVLISPQKISMFGSEIEMLTGVLNANNEITQEVAGMTLSGSNGIFLGASAGTNATALKITPSAFVIASSQSEVDSLAGNAKITGILTTTTENGQTINTSLTGLKITKNSFGIAIASGNNLEAFIMNHNGITLAHNLTNISDAGESLNGASGSYVRMSGQGIDISSEGHLTVSAANFKLTSTEHPSGQTVESVISPETVWTKVKNQANGTNTNLKLTDTEVYIGATNNNVTSYASIQAGKIELQAGTNNYIKINNTDGIEVKGHQIKINGKECWNRGDILFDEDYPSNHPTDINWIWIKPNPLSNWIYKTNNGFAGISSKGARTSWINVYNTVTESVLNGHSMYQYRVVVYLTDVDMRNSANYFGLEITSNNGTSALGCAGSDSNYQKIFSLQGPYKPYPDCTLVFEGVGYNNNIYNAAQGEQSFKCRLWRTVNSGGSNDSYEMNFKVSSISITITTDTQNTGRYPCEVYYIKQVNS